MNKFYFDKMHLLYNQNKSCVKSCQKHCLKKPIVFQKKNPFVFQHVHFFIPLFWNEKLSLVGVVLVDQNVLEVAVSPERN